MTATTRPNRSKASAVGAWCCAASPNPPRSPPPAPETAASAHSERPAHSLGRGRRETWEKTPAAG